MEDKVKGTNTLQEQLAVAVPKTKSPFLTIDGAPKYWILYYRYGNIPMLQKGFRFEGDTRGAIMRARKHCEVLKLKYILVRPMVVDLDYQENQFLMNKDKVNYDSNRGRETFNDSEELSQQLFLHKLPLRRFPFLPAH